MPPADATIWLGPFPLKYAVTPGGGPEYANDTAWSKLFTDDRYRFTVRDDPCGTAMLVFESPIEKSPVVACTAAPLNDTATSEAIKTTDSMDKASRP